jgi:FAD/FMN-containing dehydrogenase
MEGSWTLQAIFDTPNCIARHSCADEVATAIKIHVKGNASSQLNGVGHTPFPGAASISDGVTIDMVGMRTVAVNKEKTVVSIGVGALWLNGYQDLELQGFMVAGGRDSDVGVGGLVTGEGYSWFTSTMGFVVDGLVNAELVTAEGKIINVNANCYSDLFLGLKEGGNNFGVVTRFGREVFPFQYDMGRIEDLL